MRVNAVVLGLIVIALGAGRAGPAPCLAAEPSPQGDAAGAKNDEAALRQAAANYRAALAKRDFDAVVAAWAPDADYVDQLGRVLKVHTGLAKAKRLAQEDAHLAHLAPKTTTDTIRFVTPDVAIEDGDFERTGPEPGLAPQGRYTTVWVRRDGKWLVDGMRESPVRPHTAAEPLRGLSWLIGDWVAQGPLETAEISCAWGANEAFIVAHLKTQAKGGKPQSATQLIGWDPIQQRVRSFLFDSRGGFVEGLWTNEGDAWVVHASGVMADGRRTAGTKIYSRVDDNTAVWESIGGTVDGEPAADIRLKMTRKPAKK